MFIPKENEWDGRSPQAPGPANPVFCHHDCCPSPELIEMENTSLNTWKYMKMHQNTWKIHGNTWKYMKSWKYMNISSLRFHPLHARFLECLRTADLDPSRSLASPWSLQDAVYKHIWFVSLDVKPEHLSWWINVPLNQSTVISWEKKSVGPNLDLSPSFLMTEALWTEAAAPATSGSTP